MQIEYRKADIGDKETLVRMRLDFLDESRGGLSESDRNAIAAQLGPYYEKHVGLDFSAHFACHDGKAVATAFLVVVEKPAYPALITGKTGVILNVYTYPEYRHKGIATKLLSRLIEEAREQNLSRLELSATEAGKPLYAKFGFLVKATDYTEMRLQLA